MWKKKTEPIHLLESHLFHFNKKKGILDWNKPFEIIENPSSFI